MTYPGVVALVLTCSLTACAVKGPDLPPPPTPTDGILFTEDANPNLHVCVTSSPFVPKPYLCLTVGELRALLRGRRIASR